MKINAINNMYNLQNFKGLKAPTKEVANEIFGDKEKAYDVISDAKSFDIWAFRESSGGMFNRKVSYKVLLLDSDSGTPVLKEINSGSDDESMESLRKKLENCIIWTNAPMNIVAKAALEQSEIAKNNPDYAKQMSEKLLLAGISNEVRNWKTKLEII